MQHYTYKWMNHLRRHFGNQMFQVMHPFGGKVLTGNIETWGNTATCKLWRPVVLWWFVHQHHAWSGRTWHLSRVIYVCVCQAWSEFQQMVFRMWSRDLWRQAKAVSSVSISILLSIESIRCDDNFGAEVISSRSPTPQKLSAAQRILGENCGRPITSGCSQDPLGFHQTQCYGNPKESMALHPCPLANCHYPPRTSLGIWRQTSGQGRLADMQLEDGQN